MNVNHLLVLLPQLRMIENDLDQAAADDDKKLARRALISYTHTASQVASLLEAVDGPVDYELVSRLKSSAKLASAAKATIVNNARTTVRTATRDVAEQVADISGLTAGLLTQYQTKVA